MTWLPQPADWSGLTVEAQSGDPGSMLELYREALRLRRTVVDGPFSWVPSGPGVLEFRRGEVFRCLVNLSAEAVPLPTDAAVLLAGGPTADGLLPTDTAVWLSC